MPHSHENNLRLHVDGLDAFNGDVSLSVFIEKLTCLKEALIEADKIVMQFDGKGSDFLVSELRHSSPAMVGISEHYCEGRETDLKSAQSFLVEFLNKISRREFVATEKYTKLVEKLKELSNGYDKKYKSLWLDSDNLKPILFGKELSDNLDYSLPKIRVSYGTIKGIVKKYSSVSEKDKYFKLVIPGVNKEVKCLFKEYLINEASNAVEKNVTIEGQLIYRGDTYWPFEAKIKKIINHGSDSELPKLSSLYGSLSKGDSDLTAAEFIRKIRDEW